jgi:hypothetical protein
MSTQARVGLLLNIATLVVAVLVFQAVSGPRSDELSQIRSDLAAIRAQVEGTPGLNEPGIAARIGSVELSIQTLLKEVGVSASDDGLFGGGPTLHERIDWLSESVDTLCEQHGVFLGC